MRSHAYLDSVWKTTFLGLLKVKWAVMSPCSHVSMSMPCRGCIGHLTPLLANGCERQMFMDLGLATPCSPLEKALSRTFSRHVCRGLHCCSLFMLRNKLDLTICSCFWHLSLVQKFPLWSVKKITTKNPSFSEEYSWAKCHLSYSPAERSQLYCLFNREHYSLHFAFLKLEFAKWSTSHWQSWGCAVLFCPPPLPPFPFLQLEAIFTCIVELFSPVESGLVFLKGQRKIC